MKFERFNDALRQIKKYITPLPPTKEDRDNYLEKLAAKAGQLEEQAVYAAKEAKILRQTAEAKKKRERERKQLKRSGILVVVVFFLIFERC